MQVPVRRHYQGSVLRSRRLELVEVGLVYGLELVASAFMFAIQSSTCRVKASWVVSLQCTHARHAV